jgi:hypothetical protein
MAQENHVKARPKETTGEKENPPEKNPAGKWW